MRWAQGREFRVPQECNEDIYLNRNEIDAIVHHWLLQWLTGIRLQAVVEGCTGRSNKTDTLPSRCVDIIAQSEVLINRNMKRIGSLAGLDRLERTSRTIRRVDNSILPNTS